MFYKDFIRRMQNKVYFTEIKPGFFEKNSMVKVKSISNWQANTVSKEVEAFGWRVRDRISEMIESKIHDTIGQNISSKEKTGLRQLIRAKNKKIVMITIRIKTWVRRTQTKKTWFLNAQDNYLIKKTYFKLSEVSLKSIISDIQNKLKRTVESHMYKGNCTKKEAEFLLSKMYMFDIPHFYIIWKIL